MSTQYGKNAVLERLVSGSTATHTSGSATLFCSASAAGAVQSLYFFKGNGDVVDIGGGSTLSVDGDTGSGDINLATQEFTIAGGSGVDTTMSGQTLTIEVDLGEATEAAIDVSTDYGLFLDGGATGNTRKDSWADIATAMAGTVTTTGLAASSGVFEWDLQNWTASTTIADADLVGVDDGANGTLRKMTRANFLGSAAAAFSSGMTATTGDFSSTLECDGVFTANANVNLGNAGSDVTTVTSQLTCSQGAVFSAEVSSSAAIEALSLTVNEDYSFSSSGVLTIASMGGNWTNAGRTIADLGTVSTAVISGGTIDGSIIGGSTAAAGTFTTIVGTSLNCSDGNITNVGVLEADTIQSDADAAGLNINFDGNTGTNKITLTDNLASALDITEGSNSYMKFSTDNSDAYVEISQQLLMDDNIIQTGSYYVDGDVTLENDHDVTARAFITYSDVALKENIETVDNAMDMIQGLRGVSYDLKEGGKREFGFIAQEVNDVIPEVVHTSGDTMGIDYTRITSLLVEAVKTQQAEIEALKSKLEDKLDK